ncbi:MAG: hypothetical protein OMM_04285 [Candidatus Magnetoglobus multicellularis str. Araruama]|uniref:Uncharacterized protein n=1 Tax=Candidatus Magnetoglobus multicellularis str. Araruama TaxID=890399 RepID=A0A1V1P200_9BACT|nr:MAG: hypothetical protein OMM_04285 [Candidatus Magnetoglobus multicellularis str. Araruama]
MFLINYAASKPHISVRLDKFEIGQDKASPRSILEDAYGGTSENDNINFSFQEEVIQIVRYCYFHTYQIDELVHFLNCVLSKKADPERMSRYKSLYWFIYLTIDFFKYDKKNACTKGFVYFENKMNKLFNHIINDTLISPDDPLGKNDFEGDKWIDSLFAYLQSEIEITGEKDRKEFVRKLIQKFNMDEKSQSIRFLTNKHRKCIFEQVQKFMCTD